MKKLLSLNYFLMILIILNMSLNLFAQKTFNRIPFAKTTLDNGLNVIYCLDKSSPVVATVLQYKVGSSYELSTQTGYAHFFEHLMFEATADIPRASIDKYVQEAGGNLNAFTSYDRTVFHFKLPSNQLNLALWIESERMRKLKVDTIGVETQRGVVLEEMKQRTKNKPYGTWMQKTLKHLFAGTSYSWPVIGSERHIASATISQFKKFYNTYYQPNNATLVICGDFDIQAAKNSVNSYFGIYPKKIIPERTALNLTPMKTPFKETINDEKVKLPGIFLSYRGPAENDSNYYAMDLLTNILASGESSRLYQRLVDEEQVAVQASVFPLSFQRTGAIVFVGIAAPDKDIEDVEELIKEEIKKIIDDGVTDEELEKAKNIKEADFIMGKKSVMSKAMSLAKYQSFYNNPDLINTELDDYLDVTKADIQKVAKKFFGTDKTVTLIYLPKE